MSYEKAELPEVWIDFVLLNPGYNFKSFLYEGLDRRLKIYHTFGRYEQDCVSHSDQLTQDFSGPITQNSQRLALTLIVSGPCMCRILALLGQWRELSCLGSLYMPCLVTGLSCQISLYKPYKMPFQIVFFCPDRKDLKPLQDPFDFLDAVHCCMLFLLRNLKQAVSGVGKASFFPIHLLNLESKRIPLLYLATNLVAVYRWEHEFIEWFFISWHPYAN